MAKLDWLIDDNVEIHYGLKSVTLKVSRDFDTGIEFLIIAKELKTGKRDFEILDKIFFEGVFFYDEREINIGFDDIKKYLKDLESLRELADKQEEELPYKDYLKSFRSRNLFETKLINIKEFIANTNFTDVQNG